MKKSNKSLRANNMKNEIRIANKGEYRRDLDERKQKSSGKRGSYNRKMTRVETLEIIEEYYLYN